MIAKISFTLKKPKFVSSVDFIEWIKYNCGEIDSISDNNKMAEIEMADLIVKKNIKYKIF